MQYELPTTRLQLFTVLGFYSIVALELTCQRRVEIHTYSLNSLVENWYALTNAWHVFSSGSTTAQNVQSWMVEGSAVVGGSTNHAAERRGKKVIPKATECMVLTVDNLMFNVGG